MDADFPDGKASWRCGRAEIHCCTRPVGADECCEDTLEARDIQGDAITLSTSLRAQRSNPGATQKDWIALSQELLAKTGRD
jgi:hypothetical protein